MEVDRDEGVRQRGRGGKKGREAYVKTSDTAHPDFLNRIAGPVFITFLSICLVLNEG